MKEKNKDKTFQQRREELLKSRLITDNGNQSSQYLESLIEDVVLNGVSLDKQLPFLLSFAAREGLDDEQLKNDFVVLLGMLHPIFKQPSKSEKMAILYQAQICHISEEVIQHILSELLEKKKTEQEEAEKMAREKAEAERRAREQEVALPPAIRNLISNMVYVEGGTFMMGATSEKDYIAWDYEKPAHQVTLSSFSIGRYEVTQELWEAVMGTTVRQQRDKVVTSLPLNGEGSNYPMCYVSWDECQEFIRKLNALTDQNFRLPTEAEWEFAALGGNKSQHFKYSGSNDIEDVAWYNGNSGAKIHPVGTKLANELGLYDMSGNVLEWCEDWYDDYSSASQTNPKGPVHGSNRVYRGGSWINGAGGCRISNRGNGTPGFRDAALGFRLAL